MMLKNVDQPTRLRAKGIGADNIFQPVFSIRAD